MTRSPAAPSNLRNGLKWRDGRPCWEPSPANRAVAIRRVDLRDEGGEWMGRGAAIAAADARNYLAGVVREALRDDDAGGKARATLRAALNALPPVPPDPAARHLRQLNMDLIERGRAVLEDREPTLQATPHRDPRSVAAMIAAFFGDRLHMLTLSAGSQAVYRQQAKKLEAKFGTLRADELTRGQARQWYLDLKDEISVSTANIAAATAGAIFTWGSWQTPAWTTLNPFSKIGREATPGRLVFYTPEEEKAFVPWCDANGFVDVADAFVFCMWTSARQIDVCAVDMAEVEGKKTWRFTPEKTKRKAQLALPALLPVVQARIARRRAELTVAPMRHLNAEPFLWDPRHNRRHTSDSIGDRFGEARAAAVAAGVVPGGFAERMLKDTRKTCVTRLWAADVSLERIATWGGWSFKTVGDIIRKHYLSLLDGGAIETADKLEAWAETQGLALEA